MDPVSIAAVGWGISTAGWLVSPVISKLLNKCFSCLGFHSQSRIQKLETKVLQLKLMLEAAEASARSHLEMAKLERWTRSLRSAFYEAEDVLDEIDYGRLENRIRSWNWGNSSTLDFAIVTDLDVPRLLRSKLEGVLNMIEKLIDEGHSFLSLLKLPARYDSMDSATNNAGKSPTNRSQTTSAPPTVVFGRDGDLEMIRRMLRDTPANDKPISSTGKCYSVIGIHGIPGSGKTTLAQYVCEKEREDSYFNLIMWIYISQNFSVDTIFAEMLEIASSGKRGQLSNLDLLQRTLEATLRGKRFLLVLDDIWYDKSVREQKFDLLLSPLKVGEIGSRILVTSRTAEAVKALGAQNLVAISDLDKEQFFSMFMHYALDGVMISDQALLREHQLIGRKIAGKLGGSPLAARTVAGQLRRRLDTDFWRRCLNRDLLNDTMGALWWSYQQLEEPIRQCFTYCSMFPRRHELHRHQLVSLWMAQGFVETANREEDMEAIAHNHFDVLLSCSFIQQKEESSGRRHITIHDLLHELARRVSGNDCFAIDEGTVGQIPQDVRHLFIKSYNRKVFTKEILNLKTLRTIFFHQWTLSLTGEDFEAMLTSLKKLRAMHVNLRLKGKIPECIGDLKHLRYLSIDGMHVIPNMIMPPTFTKLYHLQMLLAPPDSLHCASNLEMSNLVNLRYMPTTGLNWDNFPYIGRLTLLQSLSVFKVRKARGYGIQQLQHLDNLRYGLTIEGLENVTGTGEARQAKLANKIHVSELVLNWNTGDLDSNLTVGTSNVPLTKRRRIAWLLKTGCSSDELVEGRTFDQGPDQHEILDALHPPPFVRSLKICGYCGSTYPSWLSGEQSTLENLQYLEFSFCKGSDGPREFSQFLVNLRILKILNCSWISLPESMETLKSLQYLFIEGSGNILSLPRLPPSMEKVELTCWDGSDAPPKINGFFNCLGTLVISRCSWNSLPENMECQTSLHELVINHCDGNLSLQRLPSSLKKLTLRDWNGSAPPCIGEFLVNLPSLEISYCSWNYLPENMEHLTTLEELSISDCKEILSLTRLPQSLKKLRLVSLDGSDAAPPWNSDCLVNLSELVILGCSWNTLPEMERLSSLEELIICSCKNIQSLTRFPGSLKKLKLESWKPSNEHFMISQFFVNLRELEFAHCEWSSLPEDMHLLTTLEVLIIFYCKKVRSLPRLPPSLKKLQIQYCHRSLKETCQMDGHPNWQKVVHIPEKIFFGCS